MPFSPLLALHIGAGTLGLLSGTVAIAVRKGGRTHTQSGIVFSVSMLCLAASGVSIALLKSQTGNVLGGLLTFYLVATAWRTARRETQKLFDYLALLAALAIGSACLAYASQLSQNPARARDGVPAGMEYFLGSVVLLAAAGDLRLLVRGGLSGASRIARHLWRMCFALFIASGSFFLGRQRIFPAFIRESNILILLTILPLVLLIFWLIRIRLTKLYNQNLPPRTTPSLAAPETLAALARLWPNRTHESNWLKQLFCTVGLHRWHRLDVPGPHSTTIQTDFCRWCPKVKLPPSPTASTFI